MKSELTDNNAKKIKITLLTMLLLIALSVYTAWHINRIEEAAAWYSLERTANRINEELTRRAEIDREVLRTLAEIIVSQKELESPEVQRIIDGFRSYTLMEHIALLLPGDRVMLQGRGVVSVQGSLSFAKEAARGEYISDREASVLNTGVMLLRNFVPVIKDGKTVGMLYGVVRLDSLPAFVSTSSYGGKAFYTIIDGNTGDFIINTSNRELGNVWSLAETDEKSGGSLENMRRQMLRGEKGRLIFYSPAAKSDFWYFHKPLDINQWHIGVSVPAEIAHERVSRLNGILVQFLLLELLLLTGYFIWLYNSFQRSLLAKQELAERDMLTGAFNRNRYELELPKYPEHGGSGLVCVYIDVNGLHEVNNSLGHKAGDRMLQFIADVLRKEFGDRDVYRIGGDEFVAFAAGSDCEAVAGRLAVVKAKTQAEGYFLSIGCCGQHGEIDMDLLIKDAEKAMYEDKRRFYEERADQDRRQHR